MAHDLLARVAWKVGTLVAKYRSHSIHNFTNYFSSTLDATLDELKHPVLGIRGEIAVVCDFGRPACELQVAHWGGGCGCTLCNVSLASRVGLTHTNTDTRIMQLTAKS